MGSEMCIRDRLRSQAGESQNTEHRQARRQRAAIHQWLLLRLNVHADSIFVPNRKVCIPAKQHWYRPSKWPRHHSTRRRDIAVTTQACRLCDCCHRQMAPWSGRARRTGLERQAEPRPARDWFRLQLPTAHYQRSSAAGVCRKSSRKESRPEGPTMGRPEKAQRGSSNGPDTPEHLSLIHI